MVRLLLLLGLFSFKAYSAPLTLISGQELQDKLKNSKVPVVMNFWTTWCDPCKEEFPLLLQNRKSVQAKVDFFFVSLDAKSQFTQAQDFLTSKGVDFETFFKSDSDEAFISKVLPQWAGAVPVTAFFASNGRLMKLHQGEVTNKVLKTNIELITKNKK